MQLHWIDFSPINQSNALESLCAANGIVLAAEERQCVHTSRALKGGLVSVRDDLDMDHTRYFKGSARWGSSNSAAVSVGFERSLIKRLDLSEPKSFPPRSDQRARPDRGAVCLSSVSHCFIQHNSWIILGTLWNTWCAGFCAWHCGCDRSSPARSSAGNADPLKDHIRFTWCIFTGVYWSATARI